MAYTYTIDGSPVTAKGVKLTGDGETRTLVDTRSIHADVIGGNVKIRIDPDTPADMGDDTEIGTSRAITAAEMSGAVTLGYNPSTQKVHGYVNGGEAVSRTLDQLDIPVATPSLVEEVPVTVEMGGSTQSIARGKMTMKVRKEEVKRTYCIYTTDDYNDTTNCARIVLVTVYPDNDAASFKVVYFGTGSAGAEAWVANYPTGWSVTDNGDGTLDIVSQPSGVTSWWFYNKAERHFKAFRLSDIT